MIYMWVVHMMKIKLFINKLQLIFLCIPIFFAFCFLNSHEYINTLYRRIFNFQVDHKFDYIRNYIFESS